MERRNIKNRDDLPVIIEVLRKGGVIILPTDTVYGLSTPISSFEGFQRILDLKQCGEDRNFLLLASSVEMVAKYIDSWGCVTESQMRAIWPASLTGIFPSAAGCPEWIGKTVAFRVPRITVINEIVDALNEPIFSTSANISGGRPLDDLREIEKTFGEGVDIVVEEADSPLRLPSTIMDFTREKPVVIRQGDYVWAGVVKPSK